MDNFEKAYHAAGVPQGVEVYHNEIDGAHVFFSPQRRLRWPHTYWNSSVPGVASVNQTYQGVGA